MQVNLSIDRIELNFKTNESRVNVSAELARVTCEGLTANGLEIEGSSSRD